MNRFFILALRLYQIFLAPLFGGNCRFTPSCSEYARQVLAREKCCTAVQLITKRLLRCHPWGALGEEKYEK